MATSVRHADRGQTEFTVVCDLVLSLKPSQSVTLKIPTLELCDSAGVAMAAHLSLTSVQGVLGPVVTHLNGAAYTDKGLKDLFAFHSKGDIRWHTYTADDIDVGVTGPTGPADNVMHVPNRPTQLMATMVRHGTNIGLFRGHYADAHGADVIDMDKEDYDYAAKELRGMFEMMDAFPPYFELTVKQTGEHTLKKVYLKFTRTPIG